jgi:uncharacterized protein (DUF2132 family)
VKPQPNNPLHGVTLETMIEYLVERLGYTEMARAINVNCFKFDPSVGSSLKFLRKVPWARVKVEELYLGVLCDELEQERRHEQVAALEQQPGLEPAQEPAQEQELDPPPTQELPPPQPRAPAIE